MSKAAIDFLQALRPDGPWHLAAIVPDGPIATLTTADAGKAALWIKARNAGAGIYYCPNPLKPDKPRKAVHVEHVEIVHVDLDCDKTGVTLAVAKAATLDVLKAAAAVPAPSFIVDSAGGFQALWALASPVTVAQGKAINRGIVAALKAAGLPADSACTSPVHLCRLPGTLNFPNAAKVARGRVEAPAALIEGHPGRRYEASALPAAPATLLSETGEGLEPEGIEALAELDLPTWLACAVETGELPANRLAEDASRTGKAFMASLWLARHGVEPAIVAGLLLDPRFEIGAYIWGDMAEAKGDDTARREACRTAARAARLVIERTLAGFEGAELDTEGPLNDATPREAAAVATVEHYFRRWSVAELRKEPAPEWLIERLLPAESTALLFGPQKMGKTFTAIDMACRVALGLPYAGGRAVKRVPVTYIIAEGGKRRFADRVAAWCIHNRVELAALDYWFRVVPVKVTLDDPVGVAKYLAADPEPCGLTFVDTLARSMAGEENDKTTMQAAIDGADTIQSHTGGAVVLIHHTPISEPARARGSSALQGAVDCSLQVVRVDEANKVHKRGAYFRLQVVEHRHADEGDHFYFVPERVSPGFGEDATLVLRFVVVNLDDAPAAAAADDWQEHRGTIERLVREGQPTGRPWCASERAGRGGRLDVALAGELGMSDKQAAAMLNEAAGAGVIEKGDAMGFNRKPYVAWIACADTREGPAPGDK